jgi:peptide/nickel transport system permease protein
MSGFGRYLSRRLGFMTVTLGLVTVITFGFTNVLPGDVALLILGPNADDASLQALRAQLGLDRPLYVQYADWITDLLRGQFGTSLRFNEPVGTLIAERLPRSLLLAGAATSVALVLAIPLGIVSAVEQDRWPDYLASLVAFAGISVPGFLWGVLFIFVFAVTLDVFPTGGYVPFSESPVAALRHLVLPAVSLGFALTAYIMRMTRSSMVEVLREEYIALAEAKGLKERTVVLKHGFRNAVIPVITVVAFQFSYAFGGVVVIEEVFFWPGIGQLTLTAIQSRDIPLIQGTVIVVALVFMISNLAADVLYAYADPRIRYGGDA